MVGCASSLAAAARRAAPSRSLAFAAAIQNVLERVRDQFADCLVIALHDDVQIAGPLTRVREALAALIGAAADECGLVPTGHKFVLYAPWLQHDLRAVTRAQLDEMHDDLDGYTPPDDLAAGRAVGLRMLAFWRPASPLAARVTRGTLPMSA